MDTADIFATPLKLKVTSPNGENLRVSFSRPLDAKNPKERQIRFKIENSCSQLRWNGTESFYEFPPVVENVTVLRKELGDYVEFDEEAQLLVDATEAIYAQAERRAEVIKNFLAEGMVPATPDFQSKREPMAHQRVAYWCARSAPWLALQMQMGTGKTKVANDTINYLALKNKEKNPDQPLRGLIICPRSVLLNWLRELNKDLTVKYAVGFMTWLSARYDEELNALNAVARGGGIYKSVETALKLVRTKDVDLQILIMNYDNVKGRIDLLKKFNWDFCILDESHRIKSESSKRTKHCIDLAESCKKRYILTGTPLTQSPFDLYSQYEFLGPKMGLLGYTNFHAYQNAIARFGGYKGRAVKSWAGLGKVLQAMAKWSFTVTKEQCLDLPPKVMEVRHIEMPPEQREVYDRVAQEVLMKIESLGAEVSIQNILVEYLRLAQVTSGFIKDVEGNEHTISNLKIQETMDLLEEDAFPKTIIWSRFRNEIARMVIALRERGIKCVEYHGGINDSERQVAIDSFQNDEETRVFIGTPQSGGIGINLTAAEVVVYLSNSFSLADRLQSEDRAHRIGQKKSVTYIDLIAEASIDELVYERLAMKRDMADYFSNTDELKNSLIDFLKRSA